MTKAVSLTTLLYGKEFLYYALASVRDAVDEVWVLYTPTGSQGHREVTPCPDTKEELYAIALDAAGDKLRWRNGLWWHEGEHRDAIYQYAPDADIILTVDADEVYEDGLAEDAIRYAEHAGVRQIRLPFLHLWRSFKRGFPHDPAYPARVVNTHVGGDAVTMPTDKRVWHFGYCQSSQIVGWKWANVHGHMNELRRDCDWFNDVFMANRQTDCHPVGSEHWQAEDIDLTRLPSVLQTHPYRHLDVIP